MPFPFPSSCLLLPPVASSLMLLPILPVASTDSYILLWLKPQGWHGSSALRLLLPDPMWAAHEGPGPGWGHHMSWLLRAEVAFCTPRRTGWWVSHIPMDGWPETLLLHPLNPPKCRRWFHAMIHPTAEPIITTALCKKFKLIFSPSRKLQSLEVGKWTKRVTDLLTMT